MGKRNHSTPLDEVAQVRAKLRLYVEHGAIALDGQSPQDFAREVQKAFTHLMEVRNIVNAVARLEVPPSTAASEQIQ